MTKLFRLFLSDEQIIRSIQNGEDWVLGSLYDKNLRMIMKYVNQNSGNEADAVEIFQDAIVIFWEKARHTDFILKSKISTYLYGIVKNIWLQELARRKRLTNLEVVQNNPGHSKSIDESIEEVELTEIVKRCMKELSPLCQKILSAFYYEEQSMQQISSSLNLANENVAKTKKYQCKKELESLVKKALK